MYEKLFNFENTTILLPHLLIDTILYPFSFILFMLCKNEITYHPNQVPSYLPLDLSSQYILFDNEEKVLISQIGHFFSHGDIL